MSNQTNNKLSIERIEQYANDKRMCNVNDEILEMAHRLLSAEAELQECRKTSAQLKEELEERTATAKLYRTALENAEAELQEYRKAAPVEINNEMAFAFCRAISDDAVGADEAEDIKTGLRAAFANIITPRYAAPPLQAVTVQDEPLTQIKPVADLYGITSPTGSETSFTFDAVEARNFIDGGWSVQEYVELERYQQACAGNSPVIPDGYALVPIEPTKEMYDAGDRQLTTKQVWDAIIAAAPQPPRK